MTRYKQGYFTCARFVVGVLLVVMASGDLVGQDAPQAGAPTAPATGASRDHLIGWYNLPRPPKKLDSNGNQVIPGRAALIPVFKRDGSYWSTCWGAEVPLKPCPEGLEWAFADSTMKGTKIGFDDASKTYYIIIEDSYYELEGQNIYVRGVKQPMTKVKRPSGLFDATAEPPRTNDDFVGWYEPAWFPFFRYEIRKEGDKYLALGKSTIGQESEARTERHELSPLADRLGFIMGGDEGTCLTYNAALKRFEIVKRRAEPVVRIPLARVPASLSPKTKPVPPLPEKEKLIGIPSTRG
jgi:hypothetical protein